MKKNIKDSCRIKGIPNKCLWFLVVSILLTTDGIVYCQTIVTNVSPRYSVKECRIAKDSIVLKGDMYAYGKMGFPMDKDFPKFSDGENNPYELYIPYALVLANRYDNATACYDIYIFTIQLYKHYNIDIDEGTREFLIYYLEKGARLGDKFCKEALDKMNNDMDTISHP